MAEAAANDASDLHLLNLNARRFSSFEDNACQ